MLLPRRPAKIGTSINARAEFHGDEPAPAMDISIAVLLTTAEVNELTKEPHTADAWFETANGKLTEPLLKNFAPYKLKGKFENSGATIWVGLDQLAIDFPEITLSKLSFAPQVGGMTSVSLKLQTPITEARCEIFQWMAREVEIELQFGKLKAADLQGELDLGAPQSAPEPQDELITEGFVDAQDLETAQSAIETPPDDDDAGEEDEELKIEPLRDFNLEQPDDALLKPADPLAAEREIAAAIEADRANKPRRRRSTVSVN